MYLFIPTRTVDLVSEEVLSSLLCQTIDCTVCVHPFPRQSDNKYTNIAKNRLKIIHSAVQANLEFFGMSDSDIIHRDRDNFYLLEKFLIEHQDFGAVALCYGILPKELEPPHVRLSCVLLRSKACTGIKMQMRLGECDCFSLAREMRSSGWRIGYLDASNQNLNLIFEITRKESNV